MEQKWEAKKWARGTLLAGLAVAAVAATGSVVTGILASHLILAGISLQGALNTLVCAVGLVGVYEWRERLLPPKTSFWKSFPSALWAVDDPKPRSYFQSRLMQGPSLANKTLHSEVLLPEMPVSPPPPSEPAL